MFDFDINMSDFISPSLRQQCVDTTLNTLNKLAQTLLCEQTLAQFSTLSSDSRRTLTPP